MGFAYLQRRSELVTTALSYSQQLLTKDEVAHDAILLMDRTMSTSLQVRLPTLAPDSAPHLGLLVKVVTGLCACPWSRALFAVCGLCSGTDHACECIVRTCSSA